MSQIIIHDDDTVEYVEQAVIKKVSAEEFYKQLTNQTPTNIPFLPKKTFGFLCGEMRTAFIIEQEPRIQSMRIYTALNADYKIHLPYIYWLIVIQNNPVVLRGAYALFALKPVIDESSPMFWMTFPNINFGENKLGHVCFGDVIVGDNLYLHCCVNETIGTMLTSAFNGDYFNPGTAQGLQIIKDNITKYCTPAKLKPFIDKHKIIKYLLEHSKDTGTTVVKARYLWTWHRMSEKTKPADFWNNVKPPINLKYKVLLDATKKLVSSAG